MGRPVRIVGRGVVTPAGVGLAAFRSALEAGRGAAGEIADFRLADHISSVKTYIDRTSSFALAACAHALAEAGWSDESVRATTGLCLGTAWGCLASLNLFYDKLRSSGPRHAPPLIFPHAYANAPNSLAAIEFDLRGVNLCVSAGNLSGAQALGHALDAIRLGHAARLLAGATESVPAALAAGVAGERLSEGAALVALDGTGDGEPLGWLLGYGMARREDAAGAIGAAARAALADAEIEPSQVAAMIHPSAALAAGAPKLGELFGGSSPKVVDLASIVGDTMAVGAPLGVIVATLLSADEPVLILSLDPGHHAAAVVAQGATGR